MTVPTITNEQIEEIYKSTFEGMPGCVRSAPKPNETVFAFARALLATAPDVGQAIAGQCRNDGRCQYAIDHGAEGLGSCPVGKCCMPIAPTIPEGWALVPLVPTQKMCNAVRAWTDAPRSVFIAMVANGPVAPISDSSISNELPDLPEPIAEGPHKGLYQFSMMRDYGRICMLAAAPAIPLPAAPVQGWQPIETAPKDGTEVLLYLPAPYDRIVKAAWFEPWGNWIEGDKPDPIHDEYGGIGSLLPTHYMPLPPPPVGEN